MSFGEQISVVTPVSRPELLPWVGRSIPTQAEWILVTDGELAIPAGLPPHVLIRGPRTGQWGDVQRQLALTAATRQYVYFLDDDNVMLPSLGQLVIPYLEANGSAGVLFGLLARTRKATHVWPAPHDVQIGRVDTAMFLGRREAIMQLRFGNPGMAAGWPDLRGAKGADFVFLNAFEEAFGLARLPAVYGFHNGVSLLQTLRPDLLGGSLRGLALSAAVSAFINDHLGRAQVPPWW